MSPSRTPLSRNRKCERNWTAPHVLFSAAAMLALAMVQRGAGLLSLAVLARLLDGYAIAAFAFTQSTSQIGYGVSRLGADVGLHTHLARHEAAGETACIERLVGEALSLFMLLATVGPLLLLLMTNFIAIRIFGAPELAAFIPASAALLGTHTLCQWCYSAFAGLGSFIAYSRITAATTMASPVLVVTGALLGGVWGAIAGLVAYQFLLLIALISALKTELSLRGIRIRPRLPTGKAKQMLVVGFPFYAGGLALLPVEFASQGLLAQAVGVEALGELRVVQALLTVAAMFPVALAGPMISHLAAQRNGTASDRATALQLRLNWLFALAVALSLGTVWPYAVDILFGGTFPNATSVGVIALAGYVSSTVLIVLSGAVLASRRPGRLLWIGLAQACALLLAVPLLTGTYGLAGFLTATWFSMTIGALAAFVALERNTRVALIDLWTLPLILMTMALIALMVLDLIFNESVNNRLAIGFVTLGLMIMAGWKSVITEHERERLVVSFRSKLAAVLAAKGT